MDIEGMEWQIARQQTDALRHFTGIIVQCHDIRKDGQVIPHAQILAALAQAGFDDIARRGQVSVLRRQAA
jgi:hypothetical protein